MKQAVDIFYLEMKTPDQLIEKQAPLSEPPLNILECELPQFQFNRFLYALVGSEWQWQDKQGWSDAQWRALVESPSHRTWVAYQRGAIAGYYELQKAGKEVELLYFGLAPQFIGKGLGAVMLSHAIASAWSWGDVTRVWVHTCSLDHPAALNNYMARGFIHYKTLPATESQQ